MDKEEMDKLYFLEDITDRYMEALCDPNTADVADEKYMKEAKVAGVGDDFQKILNTVNRS